ncbi:MAG TPA: DUF4440 domain-containing protein, partial [Phenylobacterium sp.]|nr:DUF4440 domain-containing protein [Phenylobacterium sp.]
MSSLLTAFAVTAALAAGAAAPAEPPTEAGVRHAENLWSEAFITGDAAALDALLDPQYVSVNPTGVARPKAQIIGFAKDYAAKHPGEHAKPLADTSTVRIVGKTALVQHHAPQSFSMDLFYYEG